MPRLTKGRPLFDASEGFAQCEDGARFAIPGVGAARDVEIGIDIGEGQVEAVHGSSDPDLPIPVVVG